MPSLMIVNWVVIFLTFLGMFTVGYMFAEDWKTRRRSTLILAFVVLFLVSLIITITVQRNIDVAVQQINATKCKPTAVQKAYIS